MDMRPVKRYADPRYPTREAVARQPELLTALPERWQLNPAVRAALASLCLMVIGQGGGGGRVAPLFPHGTGRGAFGCVVVNPPTFLSEEEACAAIRDEAAQVGLDLVAGSEPVVSVAPPPAPWYPMGEDGLPKQVPLIPDVVSLTHNLACFFMSRDDHELWDEHNQFLSVSSVDLPVAAEKLRAVLQRQAPAGAYAVFYDPVVGADPARDPSGVWRALCVVMSDEGPVVEVGAFAAWLGATYQMDGEQYTLSAPDTVVTLALDSAKAFRNDEPVMLPSPVRMLHELVFTPLAGLAALFHVRAGCYGEPPTWRVVHPTTRQVSTLPVGSLPFPKDVEDFWTTPFYQWDHIQAIARQQGEVLLRRQVRDFIAWLKAEDVI